MARLENVTRRDFLRGAAGAALAAPYVVTSNALGAPGVPPASERVTLGLIGCGGRGSAVYRGLIGAGGQAIAASDPWKDRREKWAKQIKGTPYADFREMLARDDLDAVCVASTDCWHVHHTVAAAKAGKDVYCEKPLGVSIEQDLICRDVIRRYERMFQYGTQQRSSRHCRFGCELVRSGYIGEIKEILVISPGSSAGCTGTPQTVPEGLDYEMWLGPAPWRPYCGQATGGGQWWHDYDYAIGFIAGWGAHPLDILQWGYDTHLAGNWEVETVAATIPPTGRNNVVTKWDVRINFGNGVKMDFVANGVRNEFFAGKEKLDFRPDSNYTQFVGTEGWVGISRGKIKAKPESLLKVQLKPDDVHLVESHNQGGNFIESVKTRQDPVSNIEDSVHSDIISHVSDIAIRMGRKIVWDPVQEEIVGDEQASRKLTRAYRQPWQL